MHTRPVTAALSQAVREHSIDPLRVRMLPPEDRYVFVPTQETLSIRKADELTHDRGNRLLDALNRVGEILTPYNPGGDDSFKSILWWTLVPELGRHPAGLSQGTLEGMKHGMFHPSVWSRAMELSMDSHRMRSHTVREFQDKIRSLSPGGPGSNPPSNPPQGTERHIRLLAALFVDYLDMYHPDEVLQWELYRKAFILWENDLPYQDQIKRFKAQEGVSQITYDLLGKVDSFLYHERLRD